MTHLRTLSGTYSIDPDYFGKKHNEIQWKMRVILVDWMMEVSEEFRLKRQTFHLSVHLLDKYLSITEGI